MSGSRYFHATMRDARQEREIVDLKHEIARAGYEIGDLLVSLLVMPYSNWEGVRAPYCWEHNALCWLWRNRSYIDVWPGNSWNLVYRGYPYTQWKDHNGVDRSAGYLWNNTMEPQPNAESGNGTEYYR